ncbi:hypothetical protein MKW92_043754 [Papaver armeniacum]|nr:hypothetical protein MKW92_043754 [Papaver armeniacum]
MELINNIAKAHGGVSVFGGTNLAESKVALVYGQMNEPPGARMRVGLTALTMAEFPRSGSVSALLGRMPSAGLSTYLSTEMGTLQEKITSTKRVYNFYSSSLYTATVLSRGLASKLSISRVSIDPFGELDGLPEQAFYLVEVKEIVLSTNSGQIGVLPNHAPIATAVDIGILRLRLNDQWLKIALMGGFARVGNNEITILVNDAEKGSDIDPQEAQKALEIAEANLSRAEGKRQTIEANLDVRRARTRVEAINEIS